MKKSNTHSSRGRFIVIEGGEGSGKSTLVALARERFPDAIVTREPGGAPYAEEIRTLILSSQAKNADANTQFGLFWAARADHMKNTIIPALESGKNVISDRFDATTYSYQIYGQENIHLKDLFWKIRDVYLGSYVPDAYIFLKVDIQKGLERRRGQQGQVNHFDERDISFHTRAQKGYKEFFADMNVHIVDSNKELEIVKKNFITTLELICR